MEFSEIHGQMMAAIGSEEEMTAIVEKAIIDAEARIKEVEASTRAAYGTREREYRAQMDAEIRDIEVVCSQKIGDSRVEYDRALSEVLEHYEATEADMALSHEQERKDIHEKVNAEALALITSWEKSRRQKRTAWARAAQGRMKKGLAAREQIAAQAQGNREEAVTRWIHTRGDLSHAMESRIEAGTQACLSARMEAMEWGLQRLAEIGIEGGRAQEVLSVAQSGERHSALTSMIASVGDILWETPDDASELLRQDESTRAQAIEKWRERMHHAGVEGSARRDAAIGKLREGINATLAEVRRRIQEAEAMFDATQAQAEEMILLGMAEAREHLKEAMKRITLERDLTLEELEARESQDTASLREALSGDLPPEEALMALFARFTEDEAARETQRQKEMGRRQDAFRESQAEIERAHQKNLRALGMERDQAKARALAAYREAERAAWAEYELAIAAAQVEVEGIGEQG